MPKIKKNTKSSNVLKFSFTETLSYVEGGVDPKLRKIHSGPNILFQKLTS